MAEPLPEALCLQDYDRRESEAEHRRLREGVAEDECRRRHAGTDVGRALVAMADDYASRVAVMRPVSKLMTNEPPWSSMAAPIASNKRSLTAESRAAWSLRDRSRSSHWFLSYSRAQGNQFSVAVPNSGTAAMASTTEVSPRPPIRWPAGRIPEARATDGREQTRIYLGESIGEIVGVTAGAPEQAKPTAGSQQRSRLRGTDRQVKPVPGLRRNHPVEGAASGVPVLEGVDLHFDSMVAGDLRHSWRDFDAKNVGPLLGHLSRSDAGATTHVEDVQACRFRTEQLIDHRSRIGRPAPVVALGLLVEQPGTFLGQTSHRHPGIIAARDLCLDGLSMDHDPPAGHRSLVSPRLSGHRSICDTQHFPSPPTRRTLKQRPVPEKNRSGRCHGPQAEGTRVHQRRKALAIPTTHPSPAAFSDCSPRPYLPFVVQSTETAGVSANSRPKSTPKQPSGARNPEPVRTWDRRLSRKNTKMRNEIPSIKGQVGSPENNLNPNGKAR